MAQDPSAIPDRAARRSVQRCAEPPPPTLEVASAVLAPAIGLIDGLRVDRCPGLACAAVVGVHVGDRDREATCGKGLGRGGQAVLGGHAVQPDRRAVKRHLAVHGATLRVAFDPSGSEPKRLDEKVVRGLDVGIDENRDNGCGGGHGRQYPATSPGPSWTNAHGRLGIVGWTSHPILQPILEREHVALELHDASAATWLEAPHARITLMLGLRGTLRVDGASAPAAWISGPGGNCSTVVMPGEFSTVDIQLTPLGARAVFGWPLHELAGRVTSLDELLGPPCGRLMADLQEASGWRDRLDLVDRFLLGRLELGLRPAPVVARAWARLQESDGRVRIGQLARELGCSRRLLEARFRDDVGLAPKTAARLLRFGAVQRAMRDDPVRWADLAYEHGYSDQAHLNRDFRELTGTTPARFLTQLRRSPTA